MSDTATPALSQNNVRPDTLRGLTFSFVGMVLLSCNFITVKYGLHDGHSGFNAESLTVLWMGAATVFATIWTVWRGQWGTVRQNGAGRPWLLAIGLTNAFCQLMMWQGLQHLDSSYAAFLGRFAPVMAILMGALFFRERIRALEWVAIGVIVLGGALSTLLSGATARPAEWLGVLLSLGAAFLSAAQWPLAKRCTQHVPGSVINLYRVAVAVVIVTIWGLMTQRLDFSTARPDQWVVVIVGAFLGPFLSYIMTFQSYRYWEMSRSAVVWTLQPLVVLPLAWLVFGTVIGGWKLVGGLIILAGAIWLAVLHRQTTEEPVPIAGSAPEDTKVPEDTKTLKSVDL